MAWFADPSRTLMQLMQAVVTQRLFEHPSLQTLAATATGGAEAKSRAPPRAVHPSGAGRRRDIARCRVLRATISKFEDTFSSLNARKPLGPDREPLKDIYLEYKVLKQQIRGTCSVEGSHAGCLAVSLHRLFPTSADNAASHIQAVWRGQSARRRALPPRAARDRPHPSRSLQVINIAASLRARCGRRPRTPSLCLPSGPRSACLRQSQTVSQ